MDTTNDKKDKIVLKAYRPWDAIDLESIEDANGSLNPRNTVQTQILEHNAERNHIDNTATTMNPPLATNTSITNYEYNLQAIKSNIENLIHNKSKEMTTIKEDLKKNDDPKFLIGGFLKPTIAIPGDETKQQKVDFLKHDLQKKEYELKILSDNLNTAKALEHAEQADFEKHKETRMRKLLEEKFNIALQESVKVSEQLKLAIDQLQLFATDIQQEQELRKKAENSIAKFATDNETLKADNDSLKRRHVALVNELEVSHHELDAAQQKYNEVIFTKKELYEEINLQKNTIDKLQSNADGLTKEIKLVKDRENKLFSENRALESQIAEKTTYINKLESIVSQEENLRIMSENKGKQLAQELAEMTEVLENERQKIASIKAQAKEAIAKANSALEF